MYISKYEFAKIIANKFNQNINLIIKSNTDDLHFAAKRPLHTGLICDKIKYDFDIDLPNIKTTLNYFKENE